MPTVSGSPDYGINQNAFTLEPLAGRMTVSTPTTLRWESNSQPGHSIDIQGSFVFDGGRPTGTVSTITRRFVTGSWTYDSLTTISGLSVSLQSVLSKPWSDIGGQQLLNELLRGNDTIHGTQRLDALDGGSGDDLIEIVNGGQAAGSAGNDRIIGNWLDDYLIGDANGWPLADGEGNDTLEGAGGNDWLTGDGGNDMLLGGSGNDELYGGAGDDTIDGGDGHDLIVIYLDTSGYGHPELFDGSELLGGSGRVKDPDGGTDTLKSIEAVYVHAGSGNDSIIGSGGDDYFEGGTGNDTLAGGPGNDRFRKHSGDDTFNGGAGEDTLILSGRRSDFDVARTASGMTIVTQRGLEHKTFLSDVETIEFWFDSIAVDRFTTGYPEEFLLQRRDGLLLTWDQTRGSDGFTVLTSPSAGARAIAVANFDDEPGDEILFRTAADRYVIHSARADDTSPATDIGQLHGMTVMAAGKFTHLPAADLLLNDGNGRLSFYEPETGTTIPFLTMLPGFDVVGTGDISYFDGPLDVVFQNKETGAIFMWSGNGFKDLLTLAPGSGWRVEAIGDFTGFVDADFLFFNTKTRDLLVWDVDRGKDGFRHLFTVGQGWEVAATGDFSGDGLDDILLQESATGRSIYWNGRSFIDAGTVLAGVDLIGVADLG